MDKMQESANGEITDGLAGVVYDSKDADLVKMHAYRDALGVRAAVVVYPGTESKWLAARNTPSLAPGNTDILAALLTNDDLEGVGAIAMSPTLAQSK